MLKKRWIVAPLAALAAWSTAGAAAGPPAVHAITGVRIVVAPGKVVESGTVVVRDGVIAAAGADAQAPADARIWDGEGLTVYPGLIEPFATLAWPEPEGDDEGAAAADAAGAGHPNPLVTPERDMALHAWDQPTVEKLRRAGFTTALVAPSRGLFRGQGALLNLGDGGAGENLLARRVVSVAAFETDGEGSYPVSEMGAAALMRQVLMDAAWYRNARRVYARNPAQERPPLSTSFEALEGVVAGTEPLVLEAEDLEETLLAARIARELGFAAWVVASGEEYRRLDDVRALDLPMILPLRLPAKPVVSDEEDLAVSLEELVHWKAAPENPVRLLDAGLTVAFSTHGLSDPGKVYENLAAILERGLAPEQALAALTTTPARLLGIDDRAGTVEAGKMANLVVVEGDLLVEKPKIREVWVDGRRYELREIKPPEVNPVGSWDLTIHAGSQEISVAMEITGELGALGGSISVMGNALPLGTAEVSGKSLQVAFDSTPLGAPGEISFQMQIEGDTARGSGTAPQGAFTLTATRTRGPGGDGGGRTAAEEVQR